MSEWQISNRRNWKAEVFPYDYYLPDESPECQYCLTEKQAEILRGIIEPLAWKTRWWTDSDQNINIDAITAFRDDLIRRLMMSCCGDEAPDQFRWTVDGILERSTDGGTTWTPAPEFDPRHNSTQFPPLPGEPSADKKCIAATGMSNLIKLQVGDNLTDDMSRYTLGQLIADWIATLIGTSNPFQALIVIATNQIFALIIAVLRPALTDTVYHLLTCIFYCRMADDISFDDAAVNLVTSDIGDQIGGIATLFLQQLVNLLGSVGMTNLARSGSATEGDCSDCTECLSCTALWSVFGSVPVHGTITEITDTYVEVLGGLPGNGNCYAMIRTPDKDTCCHVDHIEIFGNVGATSEVRGWTDCGVTPVEGVPQHVGLGYGTCINYFHYQSDAQFTIRVFFVDCP